MIKDLQRIQLLFLANLNTDIFSHLPGLFHAFDENRDNHIDFKEISCGLSACCRGPVAERQKCKLFIIAYHPLLAVHLIPWQMQGYCGCYCTFFHLQNMCIYFNVICILGMIKCVIDYLKVLNYMFK